MGRSVEAALRPPGPCGCAVHCDGGSESMWEEPHRSACTQNIGTETKHIDTHRDMLHRHTNTLHDRHT